MVRNDAEFGLDITDYSLPELLGKDINPGFDAGSDLHSENRIVHRIGMVACFISEMGQGGILGREIAYRTGTCPKNNLQKKEKMTFGWYCDYRKCSWCASRREHAESFSGIQ